MEQVQRPGFNPRNTKRPTQNQIQGKTNQLSSFQLLSETMHSTVTKLFKDSRSLRKDGSFFKRPEQYGRQQWKNVVLTFKEVENKTPNHS